MSNHSTLMGMYDAMLAKLGPSSWWPGDTPFEIAIGAILTQNTNWKNVEKALNNIKDAGLLDARSLHELPLPRLAELIRPAGYYNIKAKRIHNFLQFLKDEAEFELEALKDGDLADMRQRVLSINGVGPETADCILLYALDYPVFVVDTYTARILGRHGLAWEDIDYHGLQSIFMDALPDDVALFNEYHALLVRVGGNWCRKKEGLCAACPLKPFL